MADIGSLANVAAELLANEKRLSAALSNAPWSATATSPEALIELHEALAQSRDIFTQVAEDSAMWETLRSLPQRGDTIVEVDAERVIVDLVIERITALRLALGARDPYATTLTLEQLYIGATPGSPATANELADEIEQLRADLRLMVDDISAALAEDNHVAIHQQASDAVRWSDDLAAIAITGATAIVGIITGPVAVVTTAGAAVGVLVRRALVRSRSRRRLRMDPPPYGNAGLRTVIAAELQRLASTLEVDCATVTQHPSIDALDESRDTLCAAVTAIERCVILCERTASNHRGYLQGRQSRQQLHNKQQKRSDALGPGPGDFDDAVAAIRASAGDLDVVVAVAGFDYPQTLVATMIEALRALARVLSS